MASTGPLTRDSSTIALGLAQIRVGNSLSNIATATSVLASSASIGALANTKYVGNIDWYKFESGFPAMEDLSIPMKETAALECTFNEITPYNLALANGVDPLADISASIAAGTKVSSAGTVDGAKSLAVTDAGGVVSETYTCVFTGATAFSVFGSVTGHIVDAANLSSECAPDNGGNPYFSIPAAYFTGTWASDDTYSFSTVAAVSGTNAYANAHSGTIGIGSRVAPEYVRMEAVYTYPNGSNTLTIIFPRCQVAASTELDLQKEEAAGVPITFEAKRADAEVSGGDAAWDGQSLGVIVFG
ncbi:MAG: hypothetical protein KAH38_08150 [Candidatus Hydrogenedentes bacterium]|nr:hypothetical protein [Candidatus Hydrogenedentota bacterium]